mgnify:CR=1 FL=1
MQHGNLAYRHFNPRSPHGERRDFCRKSGRNQAFQPTLPARGATGDKFLTLLIAVHFNPRSPHGERPPKGLPHRPRRNFNPRSPHGERLSALPYRSGLRKISTHAPRTGSDGSCRRRYRKPKHFNPRSPHGERPTMSFIFCVFISNFNPRSPHGERQSPPTERGNDYEISTHAPRTGSDAACARTSTTKSFQPTLPARGATTQHADETP